MNAMIPNQLKFDLDLNYLPARANFIAQNETQKILGGNWHGAGRESKNLIKRSIKKKQPKMVSIVPLLLGCKPFN